MHNNFLFTKPVLKYACIFFVAAIFISMIVPIRSSIAATSDQSIEYGERLADPGTSSASDMGFLDIPRLHDGRVWTDKSVSVNTGEDADDFTVTLSALSQSFFLSDGYVVPTDTVFIIDMSASMYQESISGRPRAAVLVDALNEAIQILLDANARNRIAVVAYGGRTGGYSRAQNVLPLGRPELITGAGGFFTYRPGASENYVDVNTTNRIISSVLIQGSTPTQRGILYGSRVLTSASDLTIPALNATGDPVTGSGGAPLMLTRKPNIILMTDGEPTMAWSDYLFENDPTDTSQNYGDGSFGETGVSLLTVLTAGHRKKTVYEYYYENNPFHNASVVNYDPGNEPVGFYTISLNDVPAPLLISAAMFPFDPDNTTSPGYADNADPSLNVGNYGGAYPSSPPAPMDSMGNLLRTFAAPGPASISFYAQFRVIFGTYTWQNVTINNSENLTLDDLAFADRFFPANDLQMLRDAFASITTDIQKQSYKVVTDSAPGHEAYDGYLVFSDVLGEFTEFRGITSLEFNGTAFDRSGFSHMLINNTGGTRGRYEEILYNHMNYGNMPGEPGFDSRSYVSQTRVTNLILSNINSGYLTADTGIKYYAYGNRNFAGGFFETDGSPAPRPAGAVAVVEVFPMVGTLSAPVLPGGITDLMYITLHVVTALENNTVFEEIISTDSAGNPLNRTLNKDDQMIRWYIPSILIPQRTVDPDTGNASGNLLPIRIGYKVGLNESRVLSGVPAMYISRHHNGDDVYFYTNRHPENVTLAFYKPHELNPYYLPGRPGFNERGISKSANPTGTAVQVSQFRHFFTPGEGRTDIRRLGNNGRLTLSGYDLPEYPPEPPFVPLDYPPDRPPVRAPQTGITDRTGIYIVLLILSLGLIFCTFMYWIFNKKTK